MGDMGRRRQRDLELPARMFRRGARYYYGRAGLALGTDYRGALLKYTELETGNAAPGTFADAVKAYREQELPGKAPKTQDEYGRQLKTLALVFGAMPLDAIRTMHVAKYMRERGHPIAATREKALFSAVFNFAKRLGMTDAANPCQGVKGKTSKRKRYVTDTEMVQVLGRAGAALGNFLELAYLTGQRPSDVLKMRRTDIQDGALCVEQAKTGAKVRIEIVGPLEALLERLSGSSDALEPRQRDSSMSLEPRKSVASVFLIHDARGQRFTLSAMRRRFDKLGVDWQIRDLRAKAASDSTTALEAQRLLGHTAATTTDGYIRQRVGQRVTPIMRKIADKPS